MGSRLPPKLYIQVRVRHLLLDAGLQSVSRKGDDGKRVGLVLERALAKDVEVHTGAPFAG